MEDTQMQVVVHKATLPLQDGESVGDYNAKFSDAARAHIRQKLNLSNKDDVWGVETFGDSAVFCIYYSQDTVSTKPRMRYYSVAYVREADGKFKFSATTEVERVTTFQPVTVVTKSAEQAVAVEKAHKDAWKHASPWKGML